jgi:hypothetical protein
METSSDIHEYKPTPRDVWYIFDNIYWMLWTATKLYPEIEAFFENMSIKYMQGSNYIIHIEPGNVVRMVEYNRIYTSKTYPRGIILAHHGVLKYNTATDNLVYEYLAGVCCVNNLSTMFPIFVDTYAVYSIDDTLKKQIRQFKNISGTVLKKYLHEVPINIISNYAEMCRLYKYLCLSIQHCPNLITLGKLSKIQNINIELGIILFQIYYTLSECKHVYTHYDLHTENAGVIELEKDYCIQYIYNFVDNSGKLRIIKFKSKYIVKILDYGRSYFIGTLPDKTIIRSSDILKHIPYTPECNPPNKHGFYDDPKYFINPSVPNHSHDLRLLHSIKEDLGSIPELSHLSKNMLTYKNDFGTPSLSDSNSDNMIYSVTDAANVLAKTITRVHNKTRNSIIGRSEILYSKNKCLGTMQIFGLLKPMTFLPALVDI